MPDVPVYYMDLMCSKYPDIDQAYAYVLSSSLKCNSNETPEDGEKVTKKKDAFMEVLKEAISNNSQVQNKARKERRQLLDYQKKSHESNSWTEYKSLATSIRQMANKDNVDEQILFNLAVPVRHLEKSPGIKKRRSVIANIDCLDATEVEAEVLFEEEEKQEGGDNNN
jgi:hypothetical protein